MKIGRGMAVQRHLGQLFEGKSVAGLGEVQLLERFVERRDEPAFAALVARHGPMVLGVCRRLLADPLDVEDAFQATFLVLVRRAGSLRDRDRLGPWLFGVARKVATRARLDLARRRARECSGAGELASNPGLDEHRSELGRALVEEIDRLPGSLRDPILLCCIDDLTYDEAASRLRTTAPAIRGRLARARERLRDRLTRRGFAPTAGALGVLLSTEVASAAVPHALLMTTTKASMAGTVPAGVEALAEGVIRTMILTKSKILAAAVVACGVAGSGMGLEAQDAAPANPPVFRQQSDRLDQLEKKLDRLLNALEGRATDPVRVNSRIVRDDPAAPVRIVTPAEPAAAPVAPLPPQPPAALAATAPLAPLPPQPPAPPADLYAQGTVSAVPPPPARAVPAPRRSGQNTFAFQAGDAPASARLEAVERKLERIEARLSALERSIGSDRNPDSDAPEPRTNRGRALPTPRFVPDARQNLDRPVPDARPNPEPRPKAAPRSDDDKAAPRSDDELPRE
jgi:RNA polymerase sigma factor (sigma-70 family)